MHRFGKKKRCVRACARACVCMCVYPRDAVDFNNRSRNHFSASNEKNEKSVVVGVSRGKNTV